MKTVANVGIMTACHAGDYFMAKATCASIRHFMPDVPICVIVDGDFSIKELEDAYGVIPLPVDNFSDKRLPPVCRGTSRTKFAAIWEAPFERFLCLDSDAIVYGDWRPILSDKHWEFLCLTKPDAACPPDHFIEHFFFDRAKVAVFDVSFDWNNGLYFCAGAYAATKNCLNVERFLRAVAFEEMNPETFKFADQGIFNFMVMQAAKEGKLRVKVEDGQYILPDYPRDETIKLFGTSWLEVPAHVEPARVLHFCGTKPLVQNLKAYRAPFTAFRWRHYLNVYGKGIAGRLRALAQILGEEWVVLKPRLKRKMGMTRRG